MKKLLLCMILIMFFSCKKDNIIPINEERNLINIEQYTPRVYDICSDCHDDIICPQDTIIMIELFLK